MTRHKQLVAKALTEAVAVKEEPAAVPRESTCYHMLCGFARLE